jgi:radical SAM superfamily enzyme YgiQ (UPF0313 family)
MRVLLVNPPTLNHARVAHVDRMPEHAVPYYRFMRATCGEYKGRSTLPAEHLGLQSCAASLRAAGHEVRILNACMELHDSLAMTLKAILREEGIGLIGFSGPLEVFAENLLLARGVREAGFTGHITLGHDFVSLNHKLVLGYGEFDSVVRGEGERTIVELCNALEARASLATVAGTSWRDGGQVVVNPPREVIENLDDLPWVARDDLAKVDGVGMAASLFSRRGCPFRCSFCTTPAVPLAESVAGPKIWRSRSPAKVVEELTWLREVGGQRWVTIVDDLYLARGARGTEHALAIADGILSTGLDIEYMVDLRIDGIDREVLAMLYRSGLRQVFVGVESGAAKTLVTLDKGYSPDMVVRKLAILKDLGIRPIMGYIMWAPEDDVDALEQSFHFIQGMNYKDFSIFFQFLHIYPGTPIHRMLERKGRLEGSFPYFESTYENPSLEFFRRAMVELEALVGPAVASASYRGELGETTLADMYDRLADAFQRCLDHTRVDEIDRVGEVLAAAGEDLLGLVCGRVAAHA